MTRNGMCKTGGCQGIQNSKITCLSQALGFLFAMHAIAAQIYNAPNSLKIWNCVAMDRHLRAVGLQTLALLEIEGPSCLPHHKTCRLRILLVVPLSTASAKTHSSFCSGRRPAISTPTCHQSVWIHYSGEAVTRQGPSHKARNKNSENFEPITTKRPGSSRTQQLLQTSCDSTVKAKWR